MCIALYIPPKRITSIFWGSGSLNYLNRSFLLYLFSPADTRSIRWRERGIAPLNKFASAYYPLIILGLERLQGSLKTFWPSQRWWFSFWGSAHPQFVDKKRIEWICCNIYLNYAAKRRPSASKKRSLAKRAGRFPKFLVHMWSHQKKNRWFFSQVCLH